MKKQFFQFSRLVPEQAFGRKTLGKTKKTGKTAFSGEVVYLVWKSSFSSFPGLFRNKLLEEKRSEKLKKLEKLLSPEKLGCLPSLRKSSFSSLILLRKQFFQFFQFDSPEKAVFPVLPVWFSWESSFSSLILLRKQFVQFFQFDSPEKAVFPVWFSWQSSFFQFFQVFQFFYFLSLVFLDIVHYVIDDVF